MMIMHKRISYTSFIPAFLFLLILSVGMASCEKETISFNSNFVDNGTTNLILVDSSTVELSTIYVDSFATSGSGYLFAGNYNDPAFGKVKSESYLQVGLPFSTVTFPNGSVFDSIELILKPNKIYYGDTTIPYNISVHQLSSPLAFVQNQFAFYNIDSWNYSPTPLGSKQIIISPNVTDTVSIRLSQAMGQDLFDKLNTNALEIQSSTQFLNYFRGLALTGEGGNNLVMGFKDSVIMRLHYLKPGVISQDATIDFNITNPNHSFNHITTDRTGTPLAPLSHTNNQLFSSQTVNAAYSQYITGAMTKIRFPNIHNLLNIPGFVKIISAQLVVKPVTGTYTGIFQLPGQLVLSTTDQYNLPGAFLIGLNLATGRSGTLTGNLVLDNLYGTKTAYTYDVTSYLQQQIAITLNNKNGLLLIPSNPTITFNRVIVGDSKNNAQSQTQLKVYYVSAP